MCHTSTRQHTTKTLPGTNTAHGTHTNTAKIVSFVVVVILGMQPTLYVCKYHITTHCNSYTKVAYYQSLYNVRARSCVDIPLKANIFALYIAHFAKFVLKICINLGKNILICCKTLNKQIFLVFCLVVSKYVCTFATQFRNEEQ